MTTTSLTTAPATGETVWLKLSGAAIFWPACVYTDYTAACANSHDMSALRHIRPSLLVGELVVHFFGVGPANCLVRSSSLAPTQQYIIVQEDDAERIPFTREPDYASVFRAHCTRADISDDVTARALASMSFLNACSDALKYVCTVETAEQASEFFVARLMSAKDDARSVRQPPQQPPASVPVNSTASPVRAAPTAAVVSTPAASATSVADASLPLFSPPAAKLARALHHQQQQASTSSSSNVLQGLERIVPACHQLMLARGWETLTQNDGQTLFKQPGVSFLDMRPGENVFESLVQAIYAFIRLWVTDTMTTEDGATPDTAVADAIWPLAEAQGWSTVTAATETWFVKPNTCFDAFVPNVTIFQSKATVVLTFLQDEGVVASPMTVEFNAMEGEESDVEAEEEEAVVDDDEEEDAAAASDDDDVVEDESVEAMDVDDVVEIDESSTDDDDEEEEEVAAPVKATKALVRKIKPGRPTKAATATASKPAPKTKSKPAVAVSKPKPKPVAASIAAKKLSFDAVSRASQVPPLKITFGKIEQELRARGWFWKFSSLGHAYYTPECQGIAKSELTVGIDYFEGREALEQYLFDSGLNDDITETLTRKHNERYGGRNISSTRSSRVASTSNDKENCDTNVAPRAATKSSRKSSRSSEPSMSVSDIKFGDIWNVLEHRGWFLKSGTFEYDYFTPACADVDDKSQLIAGTDYFQSRLTLIDHLHSSGLWDKVAIAIVDGVVTSSSDDDEDDDNEDEKEEVPHRANKRGLSDRSAGNKTPLTTKKQRLSSDFRTPPEHHKRSSADNDGGDSDTDDLNDYEDGQDDSDAGDNTISPEAASQRALSALAALDAAGSNNNATSLPRKLADCFTPSPHAAKKPVAVVETVTDVDSPAGRLHAAVQRLTLGYIAPTAFAHRDSESKRILAFFETCFTQQHGASLYISGAPGCGKTALLKASKRRIAELYQEATGATDTKLLVQCHMNATSLTDPRTLFCNVAEKLLPNQDFDDADDAFDAIEQWTNTETKRSKTLVLVLDEIDVLWKKNSAQQDLCRLFALAHNDNNTFVLVGIANQVDFTERHLPQLQQQLPDATPDVVIFAPYTHTTIEQILVDRLGGRDAAHAMVNAHGLSFLARKVASTSGDVRLALDICRRVVQHRIHDATSAKAATLTTPMQLTEMLKIVKASLENKSTQAVQSLPRTLQLILFASTRLVHAVDSNNNNNDTNGSLFPIDDLFACYCDASRDAGVFKPLARREFTRSLETLASEGLIGAMELKKQLVKVLVAPSELLQSLRQDEYFARLV